MCPINCSDSVLYKYEKKTLAIVSIFAHNCTQHFLLFCVHYNVLDSDFSVIL